VRDAGATSTGGLRAGAAKIDVTPGPEQLPDRFLGVADPIHVRALVVDDGRTRAALVSVDVIGIESELWREVAGRVEGETGIPADRLLLFASHTHSVPAGLGAGFVDAIVAAVRQAVAALRPATLAAGTGTCHVNVNRNLFDPVTHQWREGRNDEGPSDKTVSVLHLADHDGVTIAVLFHYAVHAVVTGLLDLISADIPGTASAHVEQSLGHGAVALWASGCAGDQNPVFYSQTLDLRALRVAEHAARGIDISNAMPAGGDGLDREDPVVARLLAEQLVVASSLGVVLAEEVLAVVRDRCDAPRTALRLASEQRVVHSPGRRRTDTGRAGRPGTYVDDAPVPLRVGMLRLGDVAVGSVDAELFTEIGQRFRRESPAKHSLVVTLCNGRSPAGYVASSTAGGFHTFEVLSSRLQPGFAESLITDTLLDLWYGSAPEPA
jgi:neutral ceramidase